MSIHDKHRERVRARFLKEGLDHFEDHQVLELLLFYVLTREDTNPVAHALIDRFGSFSGVLDADPRELTTVKGIGPKAAFFLNLLSQTFRFYHVSRVNRMDLVLDSVERCGYYLMSHFSSRPQETVVVLCLDAKCKALCCEVVCEGSINCASVPVRKVVEIALQNGATSVVLAHNHPSGLAFPSDADVHATRRVALALDAVEITLVDHIIVADGDFVSLAQSSLYHPNECRVLV